MCPRSWIKSVVWINAVSADRSHVEVMVPFREKTWKEGLFDSADMVSAATVTST